MYFPIETKCKISAARTLAKKSEKIHRISPTQMKNFEQPAMRICGVVKSTVHPNNDKRPDMRSHRRVVVKRGQELQVHYRVDNRMA